MEKFKMDIQVRWSDLDPNFHLRHSVYYDWGALCRIEFFRQFGLTAEMMTQLHFGPILFREECVFRKEIHLSDKVWMDLHVYRSRRDYSRWTIKHTIYKNDNILAALITCDGAWLDTKARKLAIPPQQAVEVFEKMPKDEAFEWLD